MSKKKERNTKGKIVAAAWKLFYEQGYEETTVEDIVYESGTSKGSFYHYFESKDDLFSSLAFLFDEKYEELKSSIRPEDHAVDTLLYLNRELFDMIENTIDLELLKRMYATQLTTRGQKHLLDHDRVYYRLLRKIMTVGQQKGELTDRQSVNQLVRYYAFCERSMLYDWCLVGGEYSLKNFSADLMPFFLQKIKK